MLWGFLFICKQALSRWFIPHENRHFVFCISKKNLSKGHSEKWPSGKSIQEQAGDAQQSITAGFWVAVPKLEGNMVSTLVRKVRKSERGPGVTLTVPWGAHSPTKSRTCVSWASPPLEPPPPSQLSQCWGWTHSSDVKRLRFVEFGKVGHRLWIWESPFGFFGSETHKLRISYYFTRFWGQHCDYLANDTTVCPILFAKNHLRWNVQEISWVPIWNDVPSALWNSDIS